MVATWSNFKSKIAKKETGDYVLDSLKKGEKVKKTNMDKIEIHIFNSIYTPLFTPNFPRNSFYSIPNNVWYVLKIFLLHD